jgi:hypothetical protein
MKVIRSVSVRLRHVNESIWWCSGYHTCLTHRRSRVQSTVGSETVTVSTPLLLLFLVVLLPTPRLCLIPHLHSSTALVISSAVVDSSAPSVVCHPTTSFIVPSALTHLPPLRFPVYPIHDATERGRLLSSLLVSAARTTRHLSQPLFMHSPSSPPFSLLTLPLPSPLPPPLPPL